MRMKGFWPVLQLAVVLLGLVAFAGAESIGVTIAGPIANYGGPTQGVYYYPYYLNLADGSTVTVACDDYFDDVSIGESWTATTHSFPNLSGALFYNSSADLQKYQEVAWLFNQFQTSPWPDNSVNAAINFAMWDIMSPSAPPITHPAPAPNPNPYSFNPNSSAAWITAAQNTDFSNYDFSRFVIYTPTCWGRNCSNSSGSRPQEYIGELPAAPVPEPPTALLWLGGLAGLGLITWKRRSAAAGADA